MKSLAELRLEIDRVDNQIVALLGTRARLTLQVQNLKKETGLPNEDLSREQQIVMDLKNKYPEVASSLIQDIYTVLFKHSKSQV